MLSSPPPPPPPPPCCAPMLPRPVCRATLPPIAGAFITPKAAVVCKGMGERAFGSYIMLPPPRPGLLVAMGGGRSITGLGSVEATDPSPEEDLAA